MDGIFKKAFVSFGDLELSCIGRYLRPMAIRRLLPVRGNLCKLRLFPQLQRQSPVLCRQYSGSDGPQTQTAASPSRGRGRSIIPIFTLLLTVGVYEVGHWRGREALGGSLAGIFMAPSGRFLMPDEAPQYAGLREMEKVSIYDTISSLSISLIVF